MKITIRVGEVILTCNGLDLSKRDVLHVLRAVGGVALALPMHEDSTPEERTPLGFAAYIERAPQVEQDLTEWFEEAL